MTPELLCSLIIRPVLTHLDWPHSRERELLLCAIALQESGLKYRRQIPVGPAKSWWQIEPKTAADCMNRCKPVADFWLHELQLGDIGDGLHFSDLGACAVAAGILRLHPGKLPAIGKQGDAWRYYEAAWRPGKPGPERWPASYAKALNGHLEHYGEPPVKREP